MIEIKSCKSCLGDFSESRNDRKINQIDCALSTRIKTKHEQN